MSLFIVQLYFPSRNDGAGASENAVVLKGIIDIQGRMSEPFTLLVNMGPRQQEFDKDYTKYRTYLALHVDHQKAWFSIKRDGMEVNLKI